MIECFGKPISLLDRGTVEQQVANSFDHKTGPGDTAAPGDAGDIRRVICCPSDDRHRGHANRSGSSLAAVFFMTIRRTSRLSQRSSVAMRALSSALSLILPAWKLEMHTLMLTYPVEQLERFTEQRRLQADTPEGLPRPPVGFGFHSRHRMRYASNRRSGVWN